VISKDSFEDIKTYYSAFKTLPIAAKASTHQYVTHQLDRKKSLKLLN
jgi:hypothetical protein